MMQATCCAHCPGVWFWEQPGTFVFILWAWFTIRSIQLVLIDICKIGEKQMPSLHRQCKPKKIKQWCSGVVCTCDKSSQDPVGAAFQPHAFVACDTELPLLPWPSALGQCCHTGARGLFTSRFRTCLLLYKYQLRTFPFPVLHACHSDLPN